MEGISANKAQEMTIDTTVEMCRASPRSDLVKAILASTHFFGICLQLLLNIL